jgi:hypothetical protein
MPRLSFSRTATEFSTCCARTSVTSARFAAPAEGRARQIHRGRAAADGREHLLHQRDRHHESFAAENESIGIPRARVEAFWRRELAGSLLFA